ncbi:MAG: MarR family transcriptional regulator [Bacteroidales bacterium]|nr:MarR family transcriptional regulator [Bacteroidales bacterium]
MYEQLKLENQLCFRLYAASRLVTQAYHPFLSELNITYPQYLVLLVLWEQDMQPVNDLAKRLHLETNTVTPLLQRMEKDGLVTRTRGRRDGRQVIVSLTEKSREMEERAAAIPAGIGSRVVCNRLTPASVPDLFATLDELITTLENLEAQA